MEHVERIASELEAVVDRHGLAHVLDALAWLVEAKADAVRENWQDEPLARAWSRAGRRIDTAARAGHRERV